MLCSVQPCREEIWPFQQAPRALLDERCSVSHVRGIQFLFVALNFCVVCRMRSRKEPFVLDSLAESALKYLPRLMHSIYHCPLTQQQQQQQARDRKNEPGSDMDADEPNDNQEKVNKVKRPTCMHVRSSSLNFVCAQILFLWTQRKLYDDETLARFEQLVRNPQLPPAPHFITQPPPSTQTPLTQQTQQPVLSTMVKTHCYDWCADLIVL